MQERDRCKEQMGELSARLARLQEEVSRAEQAQQSSSSAVATAGAALFYMPQLEFVMRIPPDCDSSARCGCSCGRGAGAWQPGQGL